MDSPQLQLEYAHRPGLGGGTPETRPIPIFANHFHASFDTDVNIFQYDINIKFVPPEGVESKNIHLRKSELRFINDQLFGGHNRLKTAYDGGQSLFSVVKITEGEYTARVSAGEDVRAGEYSIQIQRGKQLDLSRLSDYFDGKLPDIPRDVLKGMSFVMKENHWRTKIIDHNCTGFFGWEEELHHGLAAYKSIDQSLKPTEQGLALCLDYKTVCMLPKPLHVLEFLKQQISGFIVPNDVKRLRGIVETTLKSLKIRVLHRSSKQVYTIEGLADVDAKDRYFDVVDPTIGSTKRTCLLDYFQDKWGKDIEYPNIPCLELGSREKSNEVPMEFCVLVEGQVLPKYKLHKQTADLLDKLRYATPWERCETINTIVRDGHNGDTARNFGITFNENMTEVSGHVIDAPDLKTGGSRVTVDADKCQWSLPGKSFVDAKSVERWALIDFTYDPPAKNTFVSNTFVSNLRLNYGKLGIQMAEPLVVHTTQMTEFSDGKTLESVLKNVVKQSKKKRSKKLQLIVCVVSKKCRSGYHNLKWVSETKIGVVTQCCLSTESSKRQQQYFSSLCLKINAKLGGNNFELCDPWTQFDADDHVMFIGADVNHPASMSTDSPSISAVVATVNWPAANRYAARVCPQGKQGKRCETIINFGEMCLDLLRTYVELNKCRPTKIIVFRDGVSDSQFSMVLGKELRDLKEALLKEYDGYCPRITIIVAQKRHRTRLFVENKNDRGGRSGNIPPGTVVDSIIVHPRYFDFYMCTYFGYKGTSSPTHYWVLLDENSFTSNGLQKLIYDLCFTFVRCTKPVSLVPPVHYADLAAYRGRMYQEAMMETPSSSKASFDQRFYGLHPDLEDIMFFV